MKKRGVLALLLAAALFAAPSILESAGIDLPAMTVTASGNSSAGGSTTSGNNTTGGSTGTDTKPGTGGSTGTDTKPGTGGSTGTDTKPGTGGSTGTDTKPGTGGSTTTRPSASGNNSYNPGNTGSTNTSVPAGSTVAVTNPTGHSVIVTTSTQDIARAAGLNKGESIEVTVEGAYGPLAEQLINNTAAGVNAKVAYICDIRLNIEGRDGFPPVTELNAPIRLVLGAPEGIDGNAYDFAVIRIHNGAASILPDLDNDPKTITIASDRFSAYAVIYAPKGQLKGVKDSVPKTGDTVPAAIPVAASTCLAAVAGTAAALNKKKRV